MKRPRLSSARDPSLHFLLLQLLMQLLLYMLPSVLLYMLLSNNALYAAVHAFTHACCLCSQS